MRFSKTGLRTAALCCLLAALAMAAVYVGARLYLGHRVTHLIQDEGERSDKSLELRFMLRWLRTLGSPDIVYNRLMEPSNWDKPGTGVALQLLSEVDMNKAWKICRETCVYAGSNAPDFDVAVAELLDKFNSTPRANMRALMMGYKRDNDWYAAVRYLGGVGDPMGIAELRRIFLDSHEAASWRSEALGVLCIRSYLAAEEQALICAELKRFEDNGVKPDEDTSWMDSLINATYWSSNKEAMKAVIGMIARTDEETAKRVCAAIPSDLLRVFGASGSAWTREASLQAAREYYTKVFKEPYAAP